MIISMVCYAQLINTEKVMLTTLLKLLNQHIRIKDLVEF